MGEDTEDTYEVWLQRPLRRTWEGLAQIQQKQQVTDLKNWCQIFQTCHKQEKQRAQVGALALRGVRPQLAPRHLCWPVVSRERLARPGLLGTTGAGTVLGTQPDVRHTRVIHVHARPASPVFGTRTTPQGPDDPGVGQSTACCVWTMVVTSDDN